MRKNRARSIKGKGREVGEEETEKKEVMYNSFLLSASKRLILIKLIQSSLPCNVGTYLHAQTDIRAQGQIHTLKTLMNTTSKPAHGLHWCTHMSTAASKQLFRVIQKNANTHDLLAHT